VHDGGSGVAWYDLDVSVDGGPWQQLLAQTETSYRYVGENEQSYTFRITATVPFRYAPGITCACD
jgi:hypothetical protein